MENVEIWEELVEYFGQDERWMDSLSELYDSVEVY